MQSERHILVAVCRCCHQTNSVHDCGCQQASTYDMLADEPGAKEASTYSILAHEVAAKEAVHLQAASAIVPQLYLYVGDSVAVASNSAFSMAFADKFHSFETVLASCLSWSEHSVPSSRVAVAAFASTAGCYAALAHPAAAAAGCEPDRRTRNGLC